MNPTEKALYAVAHAADARTENAPTPSSKATAHRQAAAAYVAIINHHSAEAAEANERAAKAYEMQMTHSRHATA